MFKLLLIWRYFVRKRVALIAVLAVTLLVMMVLVVLSVMSGLIENTRSRNHNWTGDIVLTRHSLVGFPYYDEFIDRLYQSDIIAQATPIIKTYGLLESDWTTPLIGVRLDEFMHVTGFAECLYKTTDENKTFTVPDITDPGPDTPSLTPEQRKRGFMRGGFLRSSSSDLMDSIWQSSQLRYYLPLPITVFAINSRGLLTGSQAGENQTFWFVNYFRTDLLDVDDTILVDFDELQKLSWMDGQDGQPPRASQIRIKLKDNIDLETAQTQIAQFWREFAQQKEKQDHAELLTDLTVQTWKEYRRDYIGPMENEKTLMIIIFSMIGSVAVFVIFAIFYMIVTEKIKDLGIIKSLGASKWALAQVFLGYGALVGMVGSLLGTALGCAIVLNANKIEGWLNQEFGFRLWPPDIYAIDKIPDVVNFSEAAIIALVAVLASLAGALLPARRAAKLVVVDALRIE